MIVPGERYRVKDRLFRGRKFFVEAFEEGRPGQWWCLPIYGGQPSYQYGWRAFNATDLERVKK